MSSQVSQGLLVFNGRFYARDVKVVETYLTSQTLMSSGIKMGRIKVDEQVEKTKIF